MSRRRLYSWEGSKHPDHDKLMRNRVGQVWEDMDGWVYFVVGECSASAWDPDGRPSYMKHGVLTMDHNSEIVDSPLEESIERPLETRVGYSRLA